MAIFFTKDLAIKKVEEVQSSYLQWKTTSLDQRISVIREIKNTLLENTETYALAITEDMNKPITQSVAEVNKCAALCDYYIENVKDFLAPKHVKTKWSESYMTFEPLGVLLGIMPWNFPFWQVFRFVIPNLLTGNTFVVKHASNVPKSAALLEKIFNTGCMDVPVYRNLFLKSDLVEDIIAHPYIQAVSLTGSEGAGRSVAAVAGKHLKKCVLELGGCNAFIVCEDADLDLAVNAAVNARMQNAGQSCIAAKRFLVHESLAEDFIKGYQSKIDTLKKGDKMDKSTEIGAMAREDLAAELEVLIQKSVKMGAEIITGGKRNGAFFEPTLMTQVTTEMPVFKEETFGPVAVVIPFSTFDEAVELSNKSDFGLGVSIFTANIKAIRKHISRFNEGAVFINEMVISDPHLAFGGVKNSGYGRELSHFALYEFANIKTVVIK